MLTLWHCILGARDLFSDLDKISVRNLISVSQEI